jgi:hypothetical protein
MSRWARDRRDLDPKKMVVVWIVFVVSSLALGALLAWMTAAFVARAKRQDLAGTVIERALPPEPRLQVDAAEDLSALRVEEDRWLLGWSWVDKKSGTAHIPIERAMRLLIGGKR